jgi:outer membrane protein
MKKLAFLALAGLMLLAASCNETAAPKIGVVDPNEVYSKCKACTEASSYLQKMSGEMQAEVLAAQKAMGEDTGKDDKAKEEKQKKFQDALSKYQTSVGQEQGRIVTILTDSFNKAMDDFRSKKGFSAILSKESVLSSAPDTDVTKGVIEAMNAMDIKWMKPAEPAAAPAAMAPAAAAPAAETKDDKAVAPAAEKKEEKKDEKKP